MKKQVLMSRPLTKIKSDGSRYVRRPQIEALIDVVAPLSRADVLARCSIRDRKHAQYLPSEILLYQIRGSRQDNTSDHFESLFRMLLARVEGTLLTAVPDGQYRNADEIRSEIASRLSLFIARDHTQVVEQLDFFEIGFDGALHKVKIDCLRKLGPQKLKTDPLDDPQTGEVLAKVEDAAQTFMGRTTNALDDPVFRSRLFAAIDSLPDDEKTVIGLVLQGLPIDAKDTTTMTIAQAIGCTEKTVRNRRDRAIKKLRDILQGEYES
jgi:RNA polymerase sigma factor (sigma-70 family)